MQSKTLFTPIAVALAIGFLLLRAPAPSLAGLPVPDSLHIPVIPAMFEDTEADSNWGHWDAADLDSALFGVPTGIPPTYDSTASTITNYYNEVSGGLYTITGVVQGLPDGSMFTVDWVSSSDGKEWVGNVLSEVDAYVDFSNFSVNNDGIIPFVAVAFAGSQAYGRGWTPNFNTVASQFVTNDIVEITPGDSVYVVIKNYILVPIYDYYDLYDTDGPQITTIGTWVHEIGHGFGITDYYCSQCGSDYEGIFAWGLMGGGGATGFDPIINTGGNPSHMSPRTKEYLGWVDPTVIEATQDSIRLRPVETSGDVVRICPTDVDCDSAAAPDEYFLFEFRKPEEGIFDLGLPDDGGLVIWRVSRANECPGGDLRRECHPSDGNPGLDVVRAAGSSLGGYSEVLFPGSQLITEIDDQGEDCALLGTRLRLHDGSASGINVSGIHFEGDSLVFDVDFEPPNGFRLENEFSWFVDDKPVRALVWGDMNADGFPDLYASRAAVTFECDLPCPNEGDIRDICGYCYTPGQDCPCDLPCRNLKTFECEPGNCGVSSVPQQESMLLLGTGQGLEYLGITSLESNMDCWSATAGDFDNDGDSDLAEARRGCPGLQDTAAVIWSSPGNNSDPWIVEATASEIHFRNVVSADLDMDGILEVYFSGEDDSENPIWEVFEYDPISKDYEDVSSDFGLPTGVNVGRAQFADFDGDGLRDLLVITVEGYGKLFLNTGVPQGEFVGSIDIPFATPTGDVTWLAAVPTDIDRDGNLDVVVVGEELSTSTKYEYLGYWVNDGESFALTLDGRIMDGGTAKLGARSMSLLDYDNDGWEDVFLGGGHFEPQLLRNSATGTASFERAVVHVGLCCGDNTKGLKRARHTSVSSADFNGDGKVDLAVALGDGLGGPDEKSRVIQAYSNQIQNTNNWLQVHLVGAGEGHSNRSAIGARVKMTAGSDTTIKEIQGGTGDHQDWLVAHFGLGTATSADITIAWPSGKTDTLASVLANQRITVYEPYDVLDVGATYQNIQLAIDAAAPGDTILITEDANPYAPIVVDRRLEIRAAENKTPEIRPNSSISACRIKADNVTLKGITFKSYFADSSDNIILNEGLGTKIENCSILPSAGQQVTSAIEGHYGLTLLNSILEADSWGVRGLSSPTGPAPDSTVFYMAGCILDSCGVALEDSITSVIERNVITNADTAFTSLPGTLRHNIIWADTSLCVIDTTLNLLADPLFCDEKQGAAGKYTLRWDSPVVAANNPWNVQVLNEPVECAWGELARSATVPVGSSVTMFADVSIPSGDSLTIGSGTTVEMWDGDLTLQNEGNLICAGTQSDSVVFRMVSPDSGMWDGIFSYDADETSLDYTTIQYAFEGVKFYQCGGTIRNALIDSCSRGVVIGDQEDSLVIVDSIIQHPSQYGMLIQLGADGLRVEDNVILGTDDAVAGIYSWVGAEKPLFTDNTIKDFSSGTGIYLMFGTATIEGNDIDSCKYGIEVNTSTATMVGDSTDSESDNLIYGNTSVGIRVGSSGDLLAYNNQIYANHTGVECISGSSVNLGDMVTDGLNSIHSNTSKCIRNRNTTGGIPAYGNWWGSCAGPSPSRFIGTVFFGDWKCYQPASSPKPRIEIVEDLPSKVLWVAPNPASHHARVRYRLADPVATLDVRVFDVQGRQVRRIREYGLNQGTYEAIWDLRTDSGSRAQSGVYWMRIETDGRVLDTKKVVVTTSAQEEE